MRKIRFYVRTFLQDRRIWFGVGAIVLVAMMVSYRDFYIMKGTSQPQSVAFYFYSAFNQKVAIATYLLAGSQAALALFCEDYGQNRLPFLLTRGGYGGYAFGLVGRVLLRVYGIGFLSGLLFFAYLLTGAPLSVIETPNSVVTVMTNNWLYADGHHLIFYLQLISSIGLMLSFYALIGVWVTVYYPNKLTSYMMPVVWWFFFTEFGLEKLVPFFLLPSSVLSADNTLIEAMEYFQFGNEAIRRIFGLIFPYCYLVVISFLVTWAIKVALERQWHFYEKEGVV